MYYNYIMIIPIKCFTCGNVIADKYRYYTEEVIKRKLNDNTLNKINKPIYLNKNNAKVSIEGHVMNDLGITQLCCRRIFLTHVDID
jgi:DNA-directed RNA polymerase subunit N (RpoN/RPB10)